MQLVFVRNVKFSAAECNSFNIRKKNIGDLASKKTDGGSNAKKRPSGCKVASFGVQSYTHHGAKLQNHDTKLQKSGCNSKYPYPLESSTLKLHKYTLKLYNYAVMGSFYHLQMLIYRL